MQGTAQAVEEDANAERDEITPLALRLWRARHDDEAGSLGLANDR